MSDAAPPDLPGLSSQGMGLQALLAERDWVRRLSARLVGDPHEAEDLAQEALTIALERPPRAAESPRGWLGSVVRNLVRQDRRRPRLREGTDAAPAESTDEVVERAELHQLVVREVLAVPEPYRRTLLLRYFEGLTPRAIAAREGVPTATVTSRLTRAHALMRERLERVDRSGRRGLALLTPLLRPLDAAPSAALPAVLLMSAKLKTAAAVSLVVVAALGAQRLARDPEPGTTPTLPVADAGDDTEALDDVASEGSVRASSRVPAPDADAAETAATVDVAQKAGPPPALTGMVLDVDGTPKESASVGFGRSYALGVIQLGGSPYEDAPVAVTGPDGRFAFAAVPDGARFVCADAEAAAPSEPGAFEPGDDLVLRLRRGGRIHGVVLRKDGSVAPDRRIRLMESSARVAGATARRMLYARTDETGAFDAPHLAPTSWGLVTYPDAEELKELGGRDVEHMSQATVVLEDGAEEYVALGASSPDAVVVRGTVTLGGAPAPRGLMQWMAECDDPMASQQTTQVDADGSYEIELPTPGAWWMRVMGSSGHGEFLLEVPAAPEFTYDIALPEGQMSGRVVDAEGAALEGVDVSHVLVEGRGHRSPLRMADDRRATDADGAFEFTGLTPGTYRVGAEHADLGIAASVLVEVGDGTPAGEVVLTLRAGTRVRGSVVDADGAPVRYAPIWVYAEDGALVNPISRTATSNDGTFKTRPLPPGRYGILTRVERTQASALDVVVGDAAPDPIALQLAPGALIVAELVHDGAPVRSHVRVRDREGRLYSGLRAARDPWSWQVYPNDSKRRHVGPLPPGTYEVTASVAGLGSVTETITLSDGDQRELRLVLD
ncbi:MAG: sigma-70 family RNA polymerase sigma factor [Planctomycetota bacterium]